MWKPADQPPKGGIDKWTVDVVVVTNYNRVFSLAYFNAKENGCWQRPTRFNDGEKVEWWIEYPLAEHKKLLI